MMMPGFEKEEGIGMNLPPQEQQESRINIEYFKGAPGIIKLIQLVLGLVLVCLWKPTWFAIPVYIAFVGTWAWVWLHFFSVQRKFRASFDWNQMELYYTGGATIAYGVATAISFLFFHIVLVIFGAQITLAYAAGTYFLLQDCQLLDIPQSTPVPVPGNEEV